MSDDLKINLRVPTVVESPAEIVPKVATRSNTDAVREVIETEQPLPVVEQGSFDRLPESTDSIGAQKSPSLRPSPISGVTPPIATRWKKGCPSPNPGGKPRGLQKAYIKQLAEIDPDTRETYADKIAKAQIKKASSEKDDGSTAAAREIRQATETDDEAGKGGGFNIGSLNVAILNQIQRAATAKELE